MAQQCFTGPGRIRLLNKTGSMRVINTATGLQVGVFSGVQFNGASDPGERTGEVLISSDEHCVVYPDDWGEVGCNCPPVPILDFISEVTDEDIDDLQDFEFQILCDPVTGQRVCLSKTRDPETGDVTTSATIVGTTTPYAGNLQALVDCNRDIEETRVCREVTVAGAWGSVGDQISHVRWFDTAQSPPIIYAEVFFNETTGAVVTGVDGTNSEPCSTSQGFLSWEKNLCRLDSPPPTLAGLYAVNATTGQIHIKDASCADLNTLAAPNPGVPSDGFFGVAVSPDIQTLWASYRDPDVGNLLRFWDISADPVNPGPPANVVVFGIDPTDSPIFALDFNPVDGILYGLTFSNNGTPTPQDYKIYEIDTVTGGAILRLTIVGEYNGGRSGFAFDPNGDIWTVTDEGATYKVSQWDFPSGAFINSPYALPSSDVAFIDITSDGATLYGQLGTPNQVDTFDHPSGTGAGTCGGVFQGLDLSLLPSAPLPSTTPFTRVFIKNLATDEVRFQNHDCDTGADLGEIPDNQIVPCPPSENLVVNVDNIVENLQRNDQQYTLWKDDDGGDITYYWRVTRIDPLSSTLQFINNYTIDYTGIYVPVGSSQSAAVEEKAIREILTGPVTYTMNGCVTALSVRVLNTADQSLPIRIVDTDGNSTPIVEGEEEHFGVDFAVGKIPALAQPFQVVLGSVGDQVMITRTEIV